MTPWQFNCCVEAHVTRTEQQHDHSAWLMWHGAVLQRIKKILPLKDFLSGAKKVSNTVDEHAIMVRLKAHQDKQIKVKSDDRSETIC